MKNNDLLMGNVLNMPYWRCFDWSPTVNEIHFSADSLRSGRADFKVLDPCTVKTRYYGSKLRNRC